MAEVIGFYAPDRATRVFDCRCGWSGTIEQMSREIHREVVDHSCPTCDTMLVIQEYPSTSETREAAAKGDEQAIEALPSHERAERRQKRAKAAELKSVEQLPGLELMTPTLFVWDVEETAEESWAIVRIAGSGQEVWRELAYWEGWERAVAVRDLLAEKYGPMYAGLVATWQGQNYNAGDTFQTVLELADEQDTPWIPRHEASDHSVE